MAFSPVIASKNITEKYKRYLRTIFRIADPVYATQFEEALSNDGSFAVGPYLDVTDSFVKGHSIADLVDSGILASDFKLLSMHLHRPLYKHQEQAIKKIVSGRNVIVSTGTGSGKTESFLIPIFNHLLREHENKVLSPGVRALIIYPMNALANDQMERLRGILGNYQDITYGCYTGQTKHSYSEAYADFLSLNNNLEPNSNELISREQMLESPPHILITNYAMLEYLMIRPKDSVFFDNDYAHHWKFVVLDEAHVYNGSTGIEVSMLLRRLKAKLNNDQIQYILTSATLGSDGDDNEVAEFGQNLCESKFLASDVIRAYRINPVPENPVKQLPISFYTEIANRLDKGESNEQIIEAVLKWCPTAKGESLEELLYEVILHDEFYWEIRRNLKSPKTVSSLANIMSQSQEVISSFVRVAAVCEKNGDRLFDARYHMFLRATEGVFITLKPNCRLFLNRKDYHYEGKERFKVFEIAVCTACNVIYLVGKSENGYLEQYNTIDDVDKKEIYLVADTISDTDEDHALEEENINAVAFELCCRCGHLRKKGLVGGHLCEHGKESYVPVTKVKVNTLTGTLTKCLACENVNSSGILRMFFTGQESVTSVIGTALFESLPSYRTMYEVAATQDDTGFGFAAAEPITTKIREAKQFIAFSDSRQAAAFFATYFDLTYQNILYRRLVVEALIAFQVSKRIPIQEFIEELIHQFERHEISGANCENVKKEAWKALLNEIVNNNGSTSLYNLGMISFSVADTKIFENKQYNLSKEEVTSICSVFALGLMSDAAISYEAAITRADKEFFTHNGVEYSYTLSDSNAKSYRRAFIPKKMSNKRLDYLMRVLERKGYSLQRERGIELLTAIWNFIFVRGGLLQNSNGSYRLDSKKLNVFRSATWYICSKCKKVTTHNVVGVCPTYKCDGELQPVDCEEHFKDNHYYNIYKSLDIRQLRVVEHTAQLDKETAYDYQKQFQRKEIDVLSCSTTFEMGVDVGTLETVFMRNVPPSPANYAQRAGRAGRSANAAAFAVTFCNKSSHDFTYFKCPEEMIRGKINPPKFKVENNKIAVRHLYASALGFFWRKHPQFFGNTSNMLDTQEERENGITALTSYLEETPTDLKVYIESFLPNDLLSLLGASDFSWLDGLVGENGVLTKAVAEYKYEVNVLQEAIKTAIEKRNRVDRFFARLRVYQNEDILSFLSRKNVLPKYGFPVDTVEMTVLDKSGASGLGLQLQRDLSMAISEYAPGSQIVANGHLITSRYIKKIPHMTWKVYDYVRCECQTLNIAPKDAPPEDLAFCRQCKESLKDKTVQTFLIPTFGFEADGNKIQKPGLKKPQRSFHGEVSYIGYRNDIEMRSFEVGGCVVELGMSSCDEMAVLNESSFYVCETCGYTDLDESHFLKVKKQKHNNVAGYPCRNDRLNRYSLGYRFETDVVLLRFITPDLYDYDTALSVLYGTLRGICNTLNIEESDISGCLQYYNNIVTGRPGFGLVLFDKTPGGAGHVRRLNNIVILQQILKTTERLMQQCDCGGEQADSSCYMCLRNYYNQKYHDRLKRVHVLGFLRLLDIDISNTH